VRAAELARIKIGQLIEANFAAEMLDSRGWSGIIEDHEDADPSAVDALIYAPRRETVRHSGTLSLALRPGRDHHQTRSPSAAAERSAARYW
jgi:hypothetical protein